MASVAMNFEPIDLGKNSGRDMIAASNLPLSISAIRFKVSPGFTRTCTSLKRFLSKLTVKGVNPVNVVGNAPSAISPDKPVSPSTEGTISSYARTTFLAFFTISRPIGVNSGVRFDRSNKVTAHSSSKAFICWLTAAWVMNTSSAAALKVWLLSIAISVFSILIVINEPIFYILYY